MSSEAVGDAVQGCCVFLFLTLQFGWFWALLQEASLPDVDFFPQFQSSVWAYAVQDVLCIPTGQFAMYTFCITLAINGFASKANIESMLPAAWHFDSAPPEVNYLQHPSICYCSAVISSFSLYC